MTARPYIRHGIDELENLFTASLADIAALRVLESELRLRPVARAITLLTRVKAALDGEIPQLPAGQKSSPEHRPTEATQPRLRAAPSVPEDLMRAASPKTSSASGAEVPPLSVEDAYKILRVASGASWEIIEQGRREAVQRAHPDKVAGLNEQKRAALQTEAKRANAAYNVILQRWTKT